MNSDRIEILKMLDESRFSYAYRAVAVEGDSKKWIDYDPGTLEEGRRSSLEIVLSYKPSVFPYMEEEYRPVCPVCYHPADVTVIKIPVSGLKENIRRFSTMILLSNRFGYFVFDGDSKEYVLDGYEIIPENEAIPVMGLYEDSGITSPTPLNVYFNKKPAASEADRIISEAVDQGLYDLSRELDSIFEDERGEKPSDSPDDSLLLEVPEIFRSMFRDEDLLVIQEIRKANQNGGFMKTEEILEDEDLRKSCLSGINKDLSRWFCKDGEEFDMIARYAGDGIIPEPLFPDDQKKSFQKLISAGARPEDLFRCKNLKSKEEIIEESEKILGSLESSIPTVFESVDEARVSLSVFIGRREDRNKKAEPVSDPEEFSQSSFLIEDPVPDPAPICPDSSDPEEEKPLRSNPGAAIEKKEIEVSRKIEDDPSIRKVESLKSRIDGGLFKTKCATYKGFTEKALLDEGSLFVDATGREDRYKSRAIMLGVETSMMYYSGFDSFDHLIRLIEGEAARSVYIYGLNCLDPLSRIEALKLRRISQRRGIKVTVFGNITGEDCPEMFD